MFYCIGPGIVLSDRNCRENHVSIQLQKRSNRTPLIGHPRDRAPIT